MISFLKKRMAEPTTYLGLALIVKGVGSLGRLDGATETATALEHAAEPLARGDYSTGIALLLGGLMGVFMSEKKK